MRIDKYNELVSEIWPEGHPANLGNCLAETARTSNLSYFVQKLTPVSITLDKFRTPASYIQSLDPSCPPDWTDSSDQCLPWFIYFRYLPLGREMRNRITAADFKTPDGNFISMPFFCLLYYPGLLKYVVALQALSLRIPIKWGQREAAHLNWFQTALLCPLWARKFMPEHLLRRAVWQYYSNEPNSNGLLDLYDEAIQKAYQP